MKQRKSNVGVKSPLNGVKNDSIVKKQKQKELSTPAKETPAKNNQKKIGKTPVKEVPPKRVEVEEDDESEEEEDSGADVAEDIVNEADGSEDEDQEEDDDDDDEEDDDNEGLIDNEADEDDENEDDSEVEEDDEEPTEVPIEKPASESSTKVKSKKSKSSEETGVQKIKTGNVPKDFPKEQVLIVTNLPKNYKQIDIVEVFAKFGTLHTIHNIRGPASCTAYVAYTSPEEAEAAQIATDKIATVKGALIRVNIQKPNPKKLKKAELKDKISEKKRETFEENKRKNEENKNRTIFIKNLKLGTTEDEIKGYFANCGVIESVRVVTRGKASFSYVVFEDESTIPSALKLHNTILNGRNIWVLRTNEQFKEMTRATECTVLLKNNQNLDNIEYSKLEAIFSKCGEIENISILCTKNVLAIVTFKDQKAAKKALKLNGTNAEGIDLQIEEYKVFTPRSKTTVFVRNVKPGVTEEEIRELFASAGPIESVVILHNFTLVRFENSDGFCKAFLLNESYLRGQIIFLEPFSEKKEAVLHHKSAFNRKRPMHSQHMGFAKRNKFH